MFEDESIKTTRLLSSATGDQCLLDKSALFKMNNTINCRVSFRTILKPLFGSLDIIFTCKQPAFQISDTDSRALSYLVKNLTVRGVTVESRNTNTPLMASRQPCHFKLTAAGMTPREMARIGYLGPMVTGVSVYGHLTKSTPPSRVDSTRHCDITAWM